MRKLLIQLYNSPRNKHGRSPLAITQKGVIISFFAAVLLSGLFGNVVLTTLFSAAKSSLKKDSIIVVEKEGTTREKKLEALTGMKVSKKIPEGLLEELTPLLTDDSISLEEFLQFVNRNFDNASLEFVSSIILGQLNYSTGFATLEISGVEEATMELGFVKPPREELKNYSTEDWKYFVAFSCINGFRKKQMEGYHKPLRLAMTFGGYIQWAILILGSWGVLMLLMRLFWAKTQLKMTLNGNLLLETENENIWKIPENDTDSAPLFYRLEEKYPGLFLPAKIIADTIRAGAFAGTLNHLEDFAQNRVASMRDKVEAGEYSLIDYISFACPSLGFIGTILGITNAFAIASEIIKAQGTFERIIAFDAVTKALAIAFDTTFVGLIVTLLLNYLFSQARQQETNMFEILEKVSKKELRTYWRKNQIPHQNGKEQSKPRVQPT